MFCPLRTQQGQQCGPLCLGISTAQTLIKPCSQAENQALQELVQQQAADGAAAAERLSGLKAKYQQLSQKVPERCSTPCGVREDIPFTNETCGHQAALSRRHATKQESSAQQRWLVRLSAGCLNRGVGCVRHLAPRCDMLSGSSVLAAGRQLLAGRVPSRQPRRRRTAQRQRQQRQWQRGGGDGRGNQ